MPTLMTKLDVKRKYQQYQPKHIKTISEEKHAYYYALPKWRALSKAYRMQHPLCELCQADNKVTIATDVHHVYSFLNPEDNNAKLQLLLDAENLMSLCKHCHGSIHGNINNLSKKLKEYIDYKAIKTLLRHSLL